MEEIQRTYIDGNSNFWGGNAWGAGIGGLIGSWLGTGGFGGWGNRWNGPNSAGIGYDTGAINAIQGQLENIQSQINNADRDLLMQTSNQNQFVGNLINNTGDAIVGAVTAGANATQSAIGNLGQTVQNGIFQNALSQTQSSAATNLAMCQGFGGVNSTIDRGIGSLNQNIAQQGFNNQLAIVEQNGANRLQAQELASQQQQCCCQVLRAIEEEGCANRELQREIQYQNTRDQLAAKAAEVESLKGQLFSTNAMAAQTAAIINALKPTTTGA